jgi:hypothetical protein
VRPAVERPGRAVSALLVSVRTPLPPSTFPPTTHLTTTRQHGLGHLPPWRWVHVRAGHQRDVQPRQRAQAGGPRTPARHGCACGWEGCGRLWLRFASLLPCAGLRVGARPQRGHHLLRAQLLLPLRQPGRHHGGACACACAVAVAVGGRAWSQPGARVAAAVTCGMVHAGVGGARRCRRISSSPSCSSSTRRDAGSCTSPAARPTTSCRPARGRVP